MTHRVLITAAATFALALGAFGLLARGDRTEGTGPSVRASLPSLPPPSATTDQRIAALQQTVRMAPHVADGYSLLAGAYAQKVRETGDASFYNRAAGALRTALALDPHDAAALTQRGALELSRHDFRDGLRDALAARRLAPLVDKPFGVLVDALVELGRYGQAQRALQEMVDRKPDLAAYARVSYFRELHGDHAGARDALSRSQTFADALQSQINALYTEFVNMDDPLRRSVIEQKRLAAIAEQDRVKADIVKQTKAIADIEDEARRANVPAGWLRCCIWCGCSPMRAVPPSSSHSTGPS